MTQDDYQKFLDNTNTNRHKCRCCGKDIYYSNTSAYINNRGKLVIKGKSFLTKKCVDNINYKLSICQNCLMRQFPNTKNPLHIFNVMCEQTKYAFDIPDTPYNIARKKYAMTLEHMINKYGEEVGRKKWEEYCKAQSLTNTFEYKKLKYNWTREQFDHYNKSRAVTKKNLIKRHGEEVGRKKWEEYCKAQSIKKSWDYMVETYGIETAKQINRSKVLTYENFIRKYGEELGKLKWIDHINNRNRSFSKISQDCFTELDKVIGDRYQTFYANKNFEYPITTTLGNTYLLDFYIPELKICIEFNGSCFHGDERVFDDNEYCNPWDKSKTAKEIRESDRLRYNTLSDEFGIKTYVIWELDYNNKSFDADAYINNILHFDK